MLPDFWLSRHLPLQCFRIPRENERWNLSLMLSRRAQIFVRIRKRGPITISCDLALVKASRKISIPSVASARAVHFSVSRMSSNLGMPCASSTTLGNFRPQLVASI
jgi:hypothetical protein